jgi:hypothetical protein
LKEGIPRKVIRGRQTIDTDKIRIAPTPRQEVKDIVNSKDKIPELISVPSTSFVPNTSGGGILGIGLLKPRPQISEIYPTDIVSSANIPIVSKPVTYSYFYIKYDNMNVQIGIEGKINSFAVVVTLSPMSVKTCSELLGISDTNITPLTKDQYTNDSFSHPKYVNDSGTPLQIRYSEITILRQVTPGRLDNIPIGYPDFDSTPDGVTSRKGPIPTPPYTDFSSSTGATSSVNIIPGGTVSFKDTSVRSPWQFAPTGWSWQFGPSANPTGSTAQNPIVAYGATGNYTVTLTASNSAGSTAKTKNNFVIVTN